MDRIFTIHMPQASSIRRIDKPHSADLIMNARDDNDDYMSSSFVVDANAAPSTSISSCIKHESAQERLVRGLATPIPDSNMGHTLLARLGGSNSTENGGQDGSHKLNLHPRAILEPLTIDVHTQQRGRLGIGSSRPIILRPTPLLSTAQADLPLESYRNENREYLEHIADIRALHDARSALWKLSEGRSALCREDDGVPESHDDDDSMYRPLDHAWALCVPDSNAARTVRKLVRRRVLMDEQQQCNKFLIRQRLNDIISLLREQYRYCLYCATQFESMQEMQERCPGSDRVLHAS